MEHSKPLPYDPSVISEEEYQKGMRALLGLLELKNEDALRGAAEMSKHPLSLEQALEQERRRQERFRK